MKKILNLFSRKSRFFINNKLITISPISFDDMVEVVFLILPYLKFLRMLKQENANTSPADLYFDIIKNSVDQISRDDLNKALCLLLGQDIKFVKGITYKEVMRILPAIIRENGLHETFLLLNKLGAFE